MLRPRSRILRFGCSLDPSRIRDSLMLSSHGSSTITTWRTKVFNTLETNLVTRSFLLARNCWASRPSNLQENWQGSRNWGWRSQTQRKRSRQRRKTRRIYQLINYRDVDSEEEEEMRKVERSPLKRDNPKSNNKSDPITFVLLVMYI